jgi:hypothetical protein
MKRRLNWRAFLFLLPFSFLTVWGGFMLIFVWKPSLLVESVFFEVVRTSYFLTSPVIIFATIGSLFAEVKK